MSALFPQSALNRGPLIRYRAPPEGRPSQNMSLLQGPIQQIGSDDSMSTPIRTGRIQEGTTGTAATATTTATTTTTNTALQIHCAGTNERGLRLVQVSMSALPPKADTKADGPRVRFGPGTDADVERLKRSEAIALAPQPTTARNEAVGLSRND